MKAFMILNLLMLALNISAGAMWFAEGIANGTPIFGAIMAGLFGGLALTNWDAVVDCWNDKRASEGSDS